MAQNMKRRRLEPATEVDRNTLGVVDVALQTAHSIVNMYSIERTRDNFAMQVPTFTLPPDDSTNAYQPHAMMPVYRMLNDRHQDLHVEAIINGKDAPFAALYPGDPEFVRWAMRRVMQPVGIAGQNSEKVDGSKDDPDLGVIKAGLQTIEAVGAIAGARAVFEIPPLGARDPRVGSVADGSDCKVQTLYTRPYNASLASVTFQRAIAHLLYDPAQWAQAMRGYSTGANVWLNAAVNMGNSYMFAGLLMVQQLIQLGKLRPTASSELDVRGLDGEFDSAKIVSRLSQFLGLTPDRGDLALLNDANQVPLYKKLKVNYLRRAFYVPTPTGQVNLADEFGMEFSPARTAFISSARGADLKDLISGSPVADLVGVQINHFQLASAAFIEAVNEEERWVAGVYLSGSNEKGSRKAIVSLGCAS